MNTLPTLARLFKDSNGFPNDDVIDATASDVLLKPEEVKMWFKHLEVVQNNRRGAKKAAATKKRNQGGDNTASKQPLRDSDGNELYNTCDAFNPPELQLDYDNNNDFHSGTVKFVLV